MSTRESSAPHTQHDKPFQLPETRFEKVRLDKVVPLPELQGHKYILAAIDRFTR